MSMTTVSYDVMALDEKAQDLLFREAHTANAFTDEPVFLMQSDRQQRYGVYRGFACCTAERDQCADRGTLHEKAW